MSATESADAPGTTAAGLEAEMDSELGALRAEGPAPGSHVRNPVYQHEQAAGTATAGSEAAATAARVTGELAAEADQERLRIEREVAALEEERPGSAEAEDAERAEARAEQDADQAVSESLDSDTATDDARRSTGTRHLHRGADPAAVTADADRALADESVAGRDLSDLDALEARVEGDAAGRGPQGS